jgi:DNA-binding beta-propeller fold protein YncE
MSLINSTTNTVIDAIPVPTGSSGIAFNPNNGDMYVTNADSKYVSVIAPLKTTFHSGCNSTIKAGQSATCNITNTYGK